MSRSLLLQRRFGPLFFTQFFAAFSDNFLKTSLVFLILFKLQGSSGEGLVTIAGAVLIFPFFLLSGLGGELADRYNKARVAKAIKFVEIFVAALSAIGFVLQSLGIMFVALGLFGILAALFGPIKYGILPDHLHDDELPKGNALVEGGTFLAVLSGSITAGYAARGGGDPVWFCLLITGFAILCWIASLFIPATAEADPSLRVEWNIFASTWTLLRELWHDTRLWRLGVAVSVFWLLGAVVVSLLAPMIKNLLGGTEPVISAYFAIFSIAIAIGSGLGAWMSHGRIVLWPVPWASLGMAAFMIDLGFALPGAPTGLSGLEPFAFFQSSLAWHIAVDLAGLSIAGGIFIVPSFAAAQHYAPVERRSRVVGAINVLNAVYMVLGSVGFGALQGNGVTMTNLFWILAGIAVVTALWLFRVLASIK